MTDEAFKEMTSFQNMYQAYKKAATCKRGKKKVMSKFVLTKSPKNGGKIK